MIVGVSGHQDRPEINWDWVRSEISLWLSRTSVGIHGWSCLASGSDQLFAEAVLAAGFAHTAVLPFEGYQQIFGTVESQAKYRELLSRSEVVELKLNHLPRQEAYLEAGYRVVDAVEGMIFVWDGKNAAGLGGTADIVAYAKAHDKRCVILDPIACVRKGEWL